MDTRRFPWCLLAVRSSAAAVLITADRQGLRDAGALTLGSALPWALRAAGAATESDGVLLGRAPIERIRVVAQAADGDLLHRLHRSMATPPATPTCP